MTTEYRIRPRKIVVEEGREYVHPAASDAEAEFFGIYRVEEDGCLEWIEDVPTREAAEQFVAARQQGGE